MARARRCTIHGLIVFTCCVLSLPAFAAQNEKLQCDASTSHYEVSFRDRGQHILHVRIAIAAQPRGDRELQLPVWNALYQVRDFSQHIFAVSAEDEGGRPVPLRKLDKSSWRVTFAHGCTVISYVIFLDDPGPFDSQVNDEHAFLNWAQILLYPADGLGQRVQIRLVDLPHEWKVRDAYVFAGADAPGAVAVEGEAVNYDSLVDSPVELGTFTESVFTQGGAKYRIVVHGKCRRLRLAKASRRSAKDRCRRDRVDAGSAVRSIHVYLPFSARPCRRRHGARLLLGDGRERAAHGPESVCLRQRHRPRILSSLEREAHTPTNARTD